MLGGLGFLGLIKAKGKGAIIITLLLFLTVLGYLYKNQIEEAAKQGYQIVQQIQTINDLQNRIEHLEEQQEKTLELLSESHKDEEEIIKEYKELKNEVQELKENNKEVKDWANSPVPSDINSLLHSNSTNNN